MTRRSSYWVVTLLAGSLLTGPGQLFSQEAEAAPAPSLSDKQKEQFLLHAKVIGTTEIPVGVTAPRRLTLSDGTLTHDAQFQKVNVTKAQFRSSHGVELNFRDYYAYNIAAYRLDRLLNLNMVPVTVKRKIGRDSGAVSWWIDDVRMMEQQRQRQKKEPPDVANWNDQLHQAQVFNQLVCNTDSNRTNLLITGDWKLWSIDFTRAFRRYKKLTNPEILTGIDRRVYNGLQGLNEEILKAEVGGYVSKSEIRALLARRDLILKHFDELIATRGEAAIICDKPGH